MNKLSKYYLTGASMVALTFSLLASTEANAAQCYTMPSCEQMGYTKSSCESHESPIKCPFNTSLMKCVPGCDKTLYTLSSCDASLGTCAQCGDKYRYLSCSAPAKLNDKTQTCDMPKPGDIYRYRGTPIGVVLYRAKAKQETVIIALHAIDHNARIHEQVNTHQDAYSAYYETYYPFATNASQVVYSSSYPYGGRDACRDIINHSTSAAPAANAIRAANQYTPYACGLSDLCGWGKWYIPSHSELDGAIQGNWDKINEALISAGGQVLYDYIWTSTATSDNKKVQIYDAIQDYPNNSDFYGKTDSNAYAVIRPVLRIPDSEYLNE